MQNFAAAHSAAGQLTKRSPKARAKRAKTENRQDSGVTLSNGADSGLMAPYRRYSGTRA